MMKTTSGSKRSHGEGLAMARKTQDVDKEEAMHQAKKARGGRGEEMMMNLMSSNSGSNVRREAEPAEGEGDEEEAEEDEEEKKRAGSTTAMKKGPWTPSEDELLMRFVKEHGASAWNTAHVLYPELRRCGKSCRLRYVNQLRHDLRKDPLTPHEERIILLGHARQGNQWSKIAAMLPGRTDNHVKNFVYMMKKKRQRQNHILQGHAPRHITSSSPTTTAASVLNYPAMGPVVPIWQETVGGCFSSPAAAAVTLVSPALLRDYDGGLQGVVCEYGNGVVGSSSQQQQPYDPIDRTIHTVSVRESTTRLQQAPGQQHEVNVQPSTVISSILSTSENAAALISRVLDNNGLGAAKPPYASSSSCLLTSHGGESINNKTWVRRELGPSVHATSAAAGYPLSPQMQPPPFLFDSNHPPPLPVVSDFSTMELPSVQQQPSDSQLSEGGRYPHSYDHLFFTSPDDMETSAATPSLGYCYSQDLDLMEAFTLSASQGTVSSVDQSAYGDGSPGWPRTRVATDVKPEPEGEHGITAADTLAAAAGSADSCCSADHVQSPDSVLAP